MPRFSAVLFLALFGILGLAPFGDTTAQASDDNTVNLYSYRQPFLIKPLLDEFTQQTGITVNMVYVKKGMLERLKAEGDNSPADMVLTSDIGSLNDMVEAGVLQPAKSEKIEMNVPAQYRHPEGLWYGLTVRARVIFASKERTIPGEVTRYGDLTKPELKGRICTRSGKHLYNISLIAALIAHDGEEAAKQWLTGVRDNLAQKPQGNDRAQARAIYEGVCDYAIANTYYMGKMAANEKKPEQRQWAKGLRIIFPNQEARGAHVNISGAAVIKSARHKQNAIRLIEYLSSDLAQRIYAKKNFEYPVKPGVPLHPLVASWGSFKADKIALTEVAKHRATASRIVDITAYDLGPQNGS